MDTGNVGVKKAKVLLVDDQLSSLIAMEECLSKLNIDIEKHTSAVTALSRMLEEEVHCVVVDYSMPEMTGFDFLKAVKEDSALRHIPVILITGKEFSSNQITKAIQAGAYDYMVKPINIHVFKARLEMMVDCAVYRQNFYYLLSFVDKDRFSDIESDFVCPLSPHNLQNSDNSDIS